MRKTILLALLFASYIGIYAQNYTISGYVTDKNSGETLAGASVFDNEKMVGTTTNTFGFYSLTLPGGKISLASSYIGFSSFNSTFNLIRDTVITIELDEELILSAAIITADRKELGVRGSQISAIDVPIGQLKAVPSLLGESDIIKALQLLPGVQSGTEGSAGFYVRGGGPDENLFLLDGVPVYNVNHMAGFFSVFNADAIKNVTLYKGGFPARFGGRLSSILDIQLNDGNTREIHGNVSVGLISAKFNLEGPLFKGKTTFNISGRRTYYDILAKPLLLYFAKDQDYDKFSAGYYFYDLNAKITHRFSDRDKLFLSFYIGDDAIYANIRDKYTEDQGYKSESRVKMNWDWGNMISAIRWNHLISNKLFMNTTATYTRYRFNLGLANQQSEISSGDEFSEEISMLYKSGIEDLSVKLDFDYSPSPNHVIKYGANYTYHRFKPGVSVAKMEIKEGSDQIKVDTTFGDKNILAHETMLYVEDNITFLSFLKANIGLHYSTYSLSDHFYHSLQPRVSLRALINDNLSVKMGYASMQQYIHLLSNSSISLPTDLWVPVTKRVTPMTSHQYSLGLFYNVRKILDLSVEGYYKEMNNLIEYKDGASFLGSTSGWEDKVSMGRGWAYGVEFLAQKNTGKTTGWIGYTWSKAERLFDRPGQEINNGEVFPAKYDRRHDINLVISHKFSEKIDLSATWVFSTGNCGTLAMEEILSSSIYHSESLVPFVENRNNYRFNNYHRLDIGINFHKIKRVGKRTWNISFYNLYNQKNPFLVYPTEETEVTTIEGSVHVQNVKLLKQLTIFPIIPSFSYTRTF